MKLRWGGNHADKYGALSPLLQAREARGGPQRGAHLRARYLGEKPRFSTHTAFYCEFGVFSGRGAARVRDVLNG